MKMYRLNPFHKGRKYPIKKDEVGRSARERTFELFDDELLPADIPGKVEISVQTARRYYADWKKQGKYLESRKKAMKDFLKQNPRFRKKLVDLFSFHLDLSREEVDLLLDKPWGQAQIVMGGWNEKIQDRYEELIRLHFVGALRIIYLFEYSGLTIQEITQTLLKMLKK